MPIRLICCLWKQGNLNLISASGIRKKQQMQKSISILALGVNAGEQIELCVSGEDEEEAAEGVLDVLKHMGNA